MLIIGLTGQSGSGKGQFCRFFEEYENFHCLDTDITARKVVEKGSDCLKELVKYFGNEILNNDGTLNRRKLASIAFVEKVKHEKLNKITHYYILKEIEKWIFEMEKCGAVSVIIDAPLLFESGADKMCNITIGVLAPFDVRLARIIKRDVIDENSAKIRLESQPKDEFYREQCTYILENDGSIDAFENKSKDLIKHIFNTHTERK